MSYKDALGYLGLVRENGTKMALNNIQKIINNLPFSLDDINFIQVAGTNGKGSTSHFITSVLKNCGKKAGLFTSPHLQDLRERITINKKWISKDEFSESIFDVKEISENLLKKGVIENIPTFFEHLFLTSLFYFKKKRVDFAVMEVGLGGRLDATSTLSPVISVITNISYDHTKTLGKRISDIAREKGGIIKKGVPVVCGCPAGSAATRTISGIAENMGSRVFNVTDRNNILKFKEGENFYLASYETEKEEYNFKVFLNGKHQVRNAAAAIKVIEILQDKGFSFPKTDIEYGIEINSVPGRIEEFNTDPKIIIDGGHNEASIRALRDFLFEREKKDLTLVFGVLRDKKYKKMASYLEPFSSDIILTEPVSNRALPAEELKKVFKSDRIYIKKNLRDALMLAKQINKEILITGSLYLAGEMRNLVSGG